MADGKSRAEQICRTVPHIDDARELADRLARLIKLDVAGCYMLPEPICSLDAHEVRRMQNMR